MEAYGVFYGAKWHSLRADAPERGGNFSKFRIDPGPGYVD